MKVDLLLHLETTHIEITADSGSNKPGATCTLKGGDNELTVESSGGVADNSKLTVNGNEVVTMATLKSYANGELNPGGVGLHATETETVRLVGAGSGQAPAEAQIKLPAGTETEKGLVKVVQEGSHGFPCPGISDRMSAGVYDPSTKTMLLLRNGADDLEKDVFLASINVDTGVYTPTAERFRPPALPITAKPINVCTSGYGTILINTTEGLYVLLTEESVNWHNWRAIKLNFAPNQLIPAPGSGGEYWRGRYTIRVGSKLYYVTSILNNTQMYTALWEGNIGSGNAIDMVFKPLTGTNLNNTPQTGTTAFFIFDKIWGTAGEKCFAYNENNYWTFGVDTAHHGDDIDFVVEGNRLRVCHDGFNYAARPGRSWGDRHNISYVIDLNAHTVTPDRITNYPMAFGTDGWSLPTHNPLMNNGGGNEEFTPIRSGGIALGLQSDNLAIVPYMHRAIAQPGVSEFEMIKAGNNNYTVPWSKRAGYGLYGGVVRMGWGAALPISDNVYIGVNTDNTPSRVEVDPFGSYGPTIPGYGPTNNRTELGWLDYRDMKQMVSCYDGRKVELNGAVLNEVRSKCASALDMNGRPDQIIEFNVQEFIKFKNSVFATISHLYRNPKTPWLNIFIHREEKVPCFGLMQFEHDDPNTPGQINISNYLFSFKPNRVTGVIDGFTFDRGLVRKASINNAVGISDGGYIGYVCSASMYRLDDGNYVATFTGLAEPHIGNTHAPQAVVVWDTDKDFPVHSDIKPRYAYLRNGWTYCKAYGFGYGYQSPAGESFYFKSYGKTKDSVRAGIIDDTNCPVYTLVMSRTDAGDNVAISQAAATKLRDKVHSIIPPQRKVQNMDLTQDRVITKSMIAGTDRIPNTPDAAYPVQPAHRTSLNNSSLADHTHNPGDFTMATATKVKRGAGRLGTLSDTETLPASVQVLADMPMSKLVTRAKEVVKLDVTMPVDVEI